MSEFGRVAWSVHRGVLAQFVFDVLGHFIAKRSLEDARSDCDGTNLVSSEVTGHGKDEAIDSCFGSTVSYLASLCLPSSNARDEHENTSFSIYWFVF